MRNLNRPPFAAGVGACHGRSNAAWRGSTALLRCLLAAGAMLAGDAAQAGPALPTGGSVASGSATIGTPANNVLTINQSSNKAIVNWNSFSIGNGGAVNFNNGSGATLNRVVGSASSAINGALNATGSVYLINPNGVIVGKTGVVKVGGNFVASTLGTGDAQFNAGGPLTLSGSSTAAVVNYGKIGSLGGNVALVARTATNAGTITAPNGAVGVLAGSQVTLRDSSLNDGKFSVDVGASGDSATNSGTIQSADAELKANGGNVYALAGNTKGVIAATGTSSVNGKVFLSAGSGDVRVTGTVTAQSAGGAGGSVMVRGNDIDIGGTIDASASAAGKAGGTVSVIGTGTTAVTGTIDARGNGAKGGSIETSGHALSADTGHVDAGQGGQWLLDPTDLIVDNALATEIDATLNAGTSVTLATTAGGSPSTPYTLTSGETDTSGSGDIVVDSALSWNTAAQLKLDSYHSIDILAPITVSGSGGVVLQTNDGGSGGSLGFGLTQLGFAGNISFTGTPNSGQSLQINGGSYTLLYSMSGLQNVSLGGAYALANSLDATSVTDWAPIGQSNGRSGFTGAFEGLGHTISNLSVSVPEFAGLFGIMSGSVSDIGVIDSSIAATVSGTAGAVASWNNGGLIADSYATGHVDAGFSGEGGGLVGDNRGTLVDVFAMSAVTGGNTIAGLAGANQGGTISNAFAVGSVTADGSYNQSIGGLVGYSTGPISNVYAAESVSAPGVLLSYVGGLVGQNRSSISDAYFTGTVAANGRIQRDGVGAAIGTGSAVSTYWNSDTNALSTDSSGATAQTTAQLQGTLPAGFSSSVWGTGPGLYPYLKSFDPNGVQTVSGFAYADAGTTPLAMATVGLDGAGAFVGSTPTGANGYYYVALPAGTLASGANLLAYVSSGGAAAAHASSVTNTADQTNFDLLGGTLTMATTSATTLSGARTAAAAFAGSDAAGATAVGNTNGFDLTATGASFTIDQAVDAPVAILQETASNANVTVAAPVTVTGAGVLTLDATGALAIDAPVTLTGGAAVSLAAAYDTTTAPGASILELSFALGAGMNFGGTNQGASLTIDGVPYTLLYNMSDVQNVQNGLAGNYALAASLDASSVAGWIPIGTDGNGNAAGGSGFTGTFEGLGNTISNLSAYEVQDSGLFGYSTGTLRDIGVRGGSFSAIASVGSLVGDAAGGLVANAYASGTVFSTRTGSGGEAGDLVGLSSGTIVDSFATGPVTGFARIGGLVGMVLGGQIVDTYASGIVAGSGSGNSEGGLVGLLDDGGSVSHSYSTGPVSGGWVYGGLIGNIIDGGVATDDYWDVQTSGLPQLESWAQGDTTAQLQGALPGSFSSATWGTGAGLYPFLKTFYPAGAKAVSGIAYGDAGITPLGGGVTVTLDAGGTPADSAITGANGYYYIAVPAGTIGGSVLTYLPGTASSAFASTGAAPGTGNVDLFANTFAINTTVTTLSALTSDIGSLTGSDIAAQTAMAGAATVSLTATGSFTIDGTLFSAPAVTVRTTAPGSRLTVSAATTLSGTNALTLATPGALAIDAPISVTGAGSLTLNAGTDTSTVAGTSILELSFTPGGSVDFGGTNNGGSLTIDGTAYTLLYNVSDLQNVNNALGGNYALATSLDASSAGYWTPLGTDIGGNVLNGANGFSGTFEGLGHTIANMTVSVSQYGGLFGYASGTIRDIGMVGGTETGFEENGGLVGQLAAGALVDNTFSSVPVNGDFSAGGLVGDSYGVIVASYATGNVISSNPGYSTGYGDGGLVGTNNGTIKEAYATGVVSGNSPIGGLVGSNNGLIEDAFATGPVSASGGYAGGLVGANQAQIRDSFAIGPVFIGGGQYYRGGLVGQNFNGTGVGATDSFWDTQTSGIGSDPSHATGATTAQLQGALPGSFSSAIWGTGAGLFPYLKAIDPNGVSVVAGTVYSDTGTTPIGYANVTVDSASGLQTTRGAGADGYYYVLLGSAGALPTSTTVMAYTNAENAFAVGTWSAAGTLTGFDISLAPHAFTTGDTTLTSALSDYTGGITATDAQAFAAAAGAPLAVTATGASFTLDTPVTTAGNYAVTTTAPNANLIVGAPLSLSGTGSLTLSAAGTLMIEAPVSVTGAVAVTLDTGIDTTTFAGRPLTELSFGNGDSLDFGATSTGATLAINGTSYTLLYSESDLAGINTNTGVQGNYALADSVDFTGVSHWTPLGTNGANAALNSPMGFSGTFEGLGNTISNLAVNTGVYSYSGLFGILSGTVRDLDLSNVTAKGVYSVGPLAGLSGGTVANVAVTGASGATGTNAVGGLVGHNNGGGRIIDATVTGTVSATGNYAGGAIGQNDGGVIDSASSDTVQGGQFVGGFAGYNDGTISATSASGHATGSLYAVGGFVGFNASGATLSGDSAAGAVTGLATNLGGFAGINVGALSSDIATGNVGASTTSIAGGLVGHNYGSVTLSSAKGTVQGASMTGGLAGWNTGSVLQSYASGAVTGRAKTGGLIGENDATATNVYATGSVTGTQYVGGLVGYNTGAIDYAYASGPVSGTSLVGGFAGANVNGTGTFLDDYWDSATTGQGHGAGNGAAGIAYIGGPKNPSPLLQSTYAGFDFSTIWVITPGHRPTLAGVQ
jgi:filamentous hemagglutinin family protein